MWCGRVNALFKQVTYKQVTYKQVTYQTGLAGYLFDFKGFFALA
jgi:hypothetical protein